jgi:hypothetical protein
MPWLAVSDRPALRAMAELELLANTAYHLLHKSGLLNGEGNPVRLLTDYRQLRAVQLQFMSALGLTPASRAQLKFNGENVDDIALAMATPDGPDDGEGGAAEDTSTPANGNEPPRAESLLVQPDAPTEPAQGAAGDPVIDLDAGAK